MNAEHSKVEETALTKIFDKWGHLWYLHIGNLYFLYFSLEFSKLNERGKGSTIKIVNHNTSPAVLNPVSKVICDCIGFALPRSVIGPEN